MFVLIPIADKTVKHLQRYFTPTDVAEHNSLSDCWVSLLGKVLDITRFLATIKDDGFLLHIFTIMLSV